MLIVHLLWTVAVCMFLISNHHLLSILANLWEHSTFINFVQLEFLALRIVGVLLRGVVDGLWIQIRVNHFERRFVRVLWLDWAYLMIVDDWRLTYLPMLLMTIVKFGISGRRHHELLFIICPLFPNDL